MILIEQAIVLTNENNVTAMLEDAVHDCLSQLDGCNKKMPIAAQLQPFAEVYVDTGKSGVLECCYLK